MSQTTISGQQTNGQPLSAKKARRNRYAVGPTIAVLFCSAANGKTFAVTIDRADLERTLAAGLWKVHNFHSSSQGKQFKLYCFRNKRKGGVELLHRFLLNAPAGKFVDHKFGRTLDNRRSCSLRFATREDNARNARKSRPNKTGYRGVCLVDGKYRATVCVNRKKITIGHFGTPLEAAKAYDEAAKNYHGEFALLNFPEQGVSGSARGLEVA